jgi:hypothetical protein
LGQCHWYATRADTTVQPVGDVVWLPPCVADGEMVPSGVMSLGDGDTDGVAPGDADAVVAVGDGVPPGVDPQAAVAGIRVRRSRTLSRSPRTRVMADPFRYGKSPSIAGGRPIRAIRPGESVEWRLRARLPPDTP